MQQECLLDRDLLAMKSGSPALARIIKDPQQLVPVSRERLCDKGEGSKVNSWVIIEVKN